MPDAGVDELGRRLILPVGAIRSHEPFRAGGRGVDLGVHEPARAHGSAADRRGGHLSTPVTTMLRMNERWARKKTTTGTAIVMSAAAWMSVGCVTYSAFYCWIAIGRVCSSGFADRYRSGTKK